VAIPVAIARTRILCSAAAGLALAAGLLWGTVVHGSGMSTAMTTIYVGSFPTQSACDEQGAEDVNERRAADFFCTPEKDGTWSLYWYPVM
jgi:hypothetical protein